MRRKTAAVWEVKLSILLQAWHNVLQIYYAADQDRVRDIAEETRWRVEEEMIEARRYLLVAKREETPWWRRWKIVPYWHEVCPICFSFAESENKEWSENLTQSMNATEMEALLAVRNHPVFSKYAPSLSLLPIGEYK